MHAPSWWWMLEGESEADPGHAEGILMSSVTPRPQRPHTETRANTAQNSGHINNQLYGYPVKYVKGDTEKNIK